MDRPQPGGGLAQLAYLYLSNGYRSFGVRGKLCDLLEERTMNVGDTEIVVSSSPSVNRARGGLPASKSAFTPMDCVTPTPTS